MAPNEPAAAVAVAFLQQYLADRDAGRTRTLAEYQAMFAGHEAVIAAEHAAVAGGADVPGDGPLAHAAHGDRYRDAVEIGRGGMGVVLRVFDPALGRCVAMKVLGGDGERSALLDQARLLRFLDEAQVTGQLQHPGIVSVLELGLDAAHRPYFTMPLIEGRRLDDVVAAMHAGDAEWSLVRVVGVLLRVCEAVAFAHERGVVHRDLKPGNVMVGRFGETYVLDWGLARVLDRPDRRDLRLRAPEAGGLDSDLRTFEGDVIGTPAYMAPEQARGAIAEVGPRSDVYSIGAMLRHALTGRAPYAAPGETTSADATLARLLAGPPASLAREAPALPGELVSICERAMQREPAARYASVAELGAELRAFLENRVVRAHASGPIAELRKWVRRNRGLAVASGAALLALVLGLIASLTQKRAADRSAHLAQQSFDLSFQAAEDLLASVGMTDLASEGGADPLRQELARKALGFYREFLALRGDDPAVEEKVARSHFRIAILESQQGRGADALRALREARAAYAVLCTRPSAGDALRQRLAVIDGELALIELLRGKPADAIPGLEAAGATLAELLQRRPDDPAALRDSARVLHNLALALDGVGRHDDALEHCDEKIALCERGVALAPREPWAHEQLGSARALRGGVLAKLRRPDQAEQALRAAVAGLDEALALHPGHRGLRWRLSDAANLLAVHLAQQQRAAEAMPVLERVTAVLRELVAAHPGVRNYHGNLGGALCNLGMLTRQAGDAARALTLLLEAREQLRRTLAIDARHAGYRSYLGNTGRELTVALLALDRHADAADAVLALVAELPDTSEHHWMAGRLLAACAECAVRDTALDAARRDAFVHDCAGRAIELLRTAQRRGKAEPASLDDADFDALRARDDFRALRAELGR